MKINPCLYFLVQWFTWPLCRYSKWSLISVLWVLISILWRTWYGFYSLFLLCWCNSPPLSLVPSHQKTIILSFLCLFSFMNSSEECFFEKLYHKKVVIQVKWNTVYLNIGVTINRRWRVRICVPRCRFWAVDELLQKESTVKTRKWQSNAFFKLLAQKFFF